MIENMAEQGTISPEDITLIKFTDDVADAIAHLEINAVRQFKLRRDRIPRESKMLGEEGLG